MATKKCANGHLYDSSIYGDNCPFCPSPNTSPTVMAPCDCGAKPEGHTVNLDNAPKPTMPIGQVNNGGVDNHTVIGGIAINLEGATADPINFNNPRTPGGEKRLAGLLVSYSANPAGEVYRIYEGRTTIGRDSSCDVACPNDAHMSSKHFLIQYVDAAGVFMAKDLGSSNGSYVNGNIYIMDQAISLKTNDIIVLGGSKFIFLAIPKE